MVKIGRFNVEKKKDKELGVFFRVNGKYTIYGDGVVYSDDGKSIPVSVFELRDKLVKQKVK